MTIPEAVQLIIRVGSLSEASGEVFVLEMGEPVKIIDLAETMIRLSGLEPGRDIAIEIVGARPGEKFHEDLFNPTEHPQPTPAQKILRAERESLDPAWVEETFAGSICSSWRATRRCSPSMSRASRGADRCPSLRRPDRHVDCARSMGSIPFAFSVHHFINSVGADAGFAAIIGLAILVLLYFAQARETASLREQAYESAQRVQQLENRLAQLSRMPAPPPAHARQGSALRPERPRMSRCPHGLALPSPLRPRLVPPLPWSPRAPRRRSAPPRASARRR